MISLNSKLRIAANKPNIIPMITHVRPNPTTNRLKRFNPYLQITHNRWVSTADIRNVAIVAHVDHGKTTIVDGLLRYTSEFVSKNNGLDEIFSGKSNDALVMDCGDLERERGITITSKVTRLDYHDDRASAKIINVVDTPGHADFAGEVDRILTMIDGVCLIVDAAEGAMAQTKYVLSRALKIDLKPILVLNKCDKEDSWLRIENGDVEIELLETFDLLGASDAQMDYVTVYASGKGGWATTDMDKARKLATGEEKVCKETSMKVLLDVILKHIPAPMTISPDGTTEDEKKEPFALAVTTVGYDTFLGRLCMGRIYSGKVQKNDVVSVLPRDLLTHSEDGSVPSPFQTSTVSGIFVTRGVSRSALNPPITECGDIVTLSGVPDSVAVGDTLTLKENPILKPLETLPIAPSTLVFEIGANTSPLAGSEGTIVASSKVHERLQSETDNNIALNVKKSEKDAEKTVVHARGELQLGILIEEMRREGYEMSVSPPQIIMKTCEETGDKLEPFEEVIIDVESEYSGTVVNALTASRKGILMNMKDSSDGKTRLEFEVPTRGLLGFRSEIATATKGTAVVNHLYIGSRKYAGHIGGVEKGKLVSNDTGKASMYALANISKRGELFIEEGELVYPGMVIGEHSRPGDLEVNPIKGKELSNIRTVNKDNKLVAPPKSIKTLEELIGYMSDDEIIEVTPKSIRLRKAELDSNVRERLARKKKKQMVAANNLKKTK